MKTGIVDLEASTKVEETKVVVNTPKVLNSLSDEAKNFEAALQALKTTLAAQPISLAQVHQSMQPEHEDAEIPVKRARSVQKLAAKLKTVKSL